MAVNKPIFAAILSLAFAMPFTAASAQVAPRNETPILALNGEGSAEAKPELAIVQIGVAVTAKVAKDALAENSKLLAAALKAAKEHGIAERDMQTAGISLRPDIIRAEKWPHREVVGYQVNNLVTLRVRDISTLGALLDRLVVLGINDIRGISFAVDNAAPLIEQARADAIKDAMRKAEKYAEAANLKIVRVLTINESGVESPPMRPMVLTRAASAPRPDVPVEAGELTYRARISATFEIAPK